ncbi:hypothetical protein A3L12_04235 [Thermococcus sp. P6]|uniref:Rrf2 family transcriptional regulator n=1 Tax=Thermococcus sp. P6 TaxID=122420 RepID=UPI000B5A0196|nr:Rrf2 family transcriptional regulator [Thermococcus sp. P6]ASJ10559.1 hypothetical protein A3L12_04235 [Thermococcus sp. P6]
MSVRSRDIVYKVLATKKRAMALQALSAELETPMPVVLKILKGLESDGLVEVFYGQDKAAIMARAKTIGELI